MFFLDVHNPVWSRPNDSMLVRAYTKVISTGGNKMWPPIDLEGSIPGEPLRGTNILVNWTYVTAAYGPGQVMCDNRVSVDLGTQVLGRSETRCYNQSS